jgi:Ribbon-helix-helix protein, copG family
MPKKLDLVFPELQERGTVPTSIRFSSALLARVDELAEERGVTRTEAIERLLVHALESLGLVEKGARPVEELSQRRRP